MMNNRKAVIDLLLVSALGLFVELVFIRWVASELRVLAFYKNFALIAAFLGLGLGFVVRHNNPERRLFERYFFPLLSFSVIVILVLGRTTLSELIILNRSNTQEFLWAATLNVNDPFVEAILSIAFYAILWLLFVLFTVLFIPLGELTARKFAAFKPLKGYTINVVGSLTGILIYTLISFLAWPPSAWFLMIAVTGLLMLPRDNSWLWRGQFIFAVFPIALTMFWPTGAERTLWSPYYRVDLESQYAQNEPDVRLGYALSVNQAWHQQIHNLDPNFVSSNYQLAPEHFDNLQSKYDAPYATSPRLDNVLIVGAGTGNDVAGALRAGAKKIVAVEIDPLILKLGQELHPERPYADTERVTQVVQDARSFFRHDDQKYDLIVFGLLDSHTLFSTASSVRLDNFVYTLESLSDVRELLEEDGILALSFGVPPDHKWVGERLFRNLTDVFGHPPQVYEFVDHDILFLIALEPLPELLIQNPYIKVSSDYGYQESLGAVTDDWPFLYLSRRGVPSEYVIAIVGIILISFLMLRRTIPDLRQINLHFLFMGAAFFLLETKSITEMALLFGSTWIVNAVVISAILLMIVFANILVIRYQLKDVRLFYVLLIGTLVLNYFVPVSRFLGLSFFWRISLVAITQVIPLFFAGIIFAITFSQTDSIEIALGSNLLGAVLGGITEYVSLAVGIRSLYLLAMIFYVFSALTLPQKISVKWQLPKFRRVKMLK